MKKEKDDRKISVRLNNEAYKKVTDAVNDGINKSEYINNAPYQSHITQKQIGVGVTAVGAVSAVAGICTSHAVLTIGGVIVAAAGIALIVSDKGDA